MALSSNVLACMSMYTYTYRYMDASYIYIIILLFMTKYIDANLLAPSMTRWPIQLR